jgi:hypothetical protein
MDAIPLQTLALGCGESDVHSFDHIFRVNRTSLTRHMDDVVAGHVSPASRNATAAGTVA